MTRSKLLYRTLSIYQYYKIFGGRLLMLGVIGLTIWLYDNNHVAMIIIAVIALFFFLLIGEDELKVYTDKVSYRSSSLIFPSRKVFLLKDIRSFKVEGIHDFNSDLDTDMQDLKTKRTGLYGVIDKIKNPPKEDTYNHIEIVYNDGKIVAIDTHIYIDKLEEAAKIISSLFKGDSDETGFSTQ